MSFIINPSSISFAQAKADIRAWLDSKPDATQWKDFYDSSTGTEMIELCAGLSVYYAFNNATTKREVYMKYAENRSSVLAAAESYGYSSYRGRNSVLTLNVVPNFTGIIDKYQIVGAVKDKYLIALDDYTVNNNVPIQIQCVVGELKTEQQTVSSENPSQFRFLNGPVSEDIRIKLNGTVVDHSNLMLDLVNEKFVAISNVYGSVHVMYLNLPYFVTRFTTGDIILIEYVELYDLDFETSNVTFDYGVISSTVVTSLYQGPEDIELIRINAPLFNDTQFTVRGRDDYLKIFRLLDSSIVDTSSIDVSAAVVKLFAVLDDVSLFTQSEKDSLISQMAIHRSMGVQPPTIGDPVINFLDLLVSVKLSSSGGNPVTDVNSILTEHEQVLGHELNFDDIEESVEDLSYVKTARVQINSSEWETSTTYARGTHVHPDPENGYVYEMKRIIYSSSSTEPTWPTTIGDQVVDGDIVWECSRISTPCDVGVIDAWLASTEYVLEDLAMPTVANGFVYAVADYINLSQSSYESQQILFDGIPTTGTFRLEFGSEKTVNLPYNATANDIQTALNDLDGLSDVVVDGTSPSFIVDFLGDDANQDQPLITLDSPGTNEENCIHFDLTPNVGSWKLRFNGQTTPALAYDITTSALQAALEALTSIGAGNVEVQPGQSGDAYRVIFKGSLGLQPLSYILELIDNLLVAATTIDITPSTTTEGVLPDLGADEVQRIDFDLTPTGGNWSINFDGKTTALLGIAETAATIKTALEALSNIAVGDISVSGDYTSGFTVSFLSTGAYAKTDVPLMTIPYNTLVAGSQSVDVEPVAVTEGRATDPGTDCVQRLDFDFVPDSGSFIIDYDGDDTTAINWDDDATDVQNALNALSSLSGVLVTGDFSSGFEITFAGSDGKQPQPEITISSNSLATTSAGVTVIITKCVVGEVPANNTDVNVAVSVVQSGFNPEPDWEAAVGEGDIC